MGPTRLHMNRIALSLASLMLFQSCVVYHKTPKSLDEASRLRTTTRITNHTGVTDKYDFILYEDGMYYGVFKDFDERGKWVKTPLQESEIEVVQTKNKTASTLITIGLITVPVLTLVGVIAVGSISYSPW